MKRSPAWMLALAPVAGLLMAATPANAQWGPSPYSAAGGYPVQQAYFTPYGMGPAGPPPSAYGQNGALAGYNSPMVIYDPAVMPAAFQNACPGCGGGGCNACGGGAAGGLFQGGAGCGPACGCAPGCNLGMGTPWGIGTNNGQGVWSKHGPQGTGGCCTPRWWDVQTEFMYLTREEVSRTVNFTSQGVGGPIVLSTNDLDFEETPGFRLMGAILLGPGTNLEGGYFGMFEWNTAATVASANNDLYSALSNFGLINIPNLPEANGSNFQSIAYSTDVHNWELNVRRRWVSPNCRFHTSWMVGARYFVLNEDFTYFISAGDPVIGTTTYDVDTFNDLIGFQTGGDLLLCVIPRVKVGGNIKAGIYGVRAENKTFIQLNRPDPILNQSFSEFAGDEDAAFIGEGGFECIIEATEHITLRAGYQLLYVNGVALAPENFNPDFRLVERAVTVNDNGQVFYHGFTAGFEYTW